MKRINDLLNSGRKGIFVQTDEESRFIDEMKMLAKSKAMQLFSFSITQGMVNEITQEQPTRLDIEKFFEFVDNSKNNTIYIVKDVHDLWVNAKFKRRIRDSLEKFNEIYSPVLFVSPIMNIPQELSRTIALAPFETPNKDIILSHIHSMIHVLQSQNLPQPNEREIEAIANALKGLTESEIISILKECSVSERMLSVDYIVKEKRQTIKKTGLLQYITDIGSMSDVGGNDLLKDWLDKARYSFDVDEQKFKIKSAKGIVLAGFPGVGKSLIPKSIAYDWNLPLLKMNMADILGSHVGESEKNIEKAMRLAESVSPCILWIDELDKALGGSNGNTDGGTTTRVIGQLLTWLSDKKESVFVIGTANDLTKTKDELTRAGRFDEIFYLTLPHKEDRAEIIKIHLNAHDYEVVDKPTLKNHFSTADIQLLAEATYMYSGAEIEQVIVSATRNAYANFRKGDTDTHWIKKEDVLHECETFIPLSTRNPHLFSSLEKWAAHSAKRASSRDVNTEQVKHALSLVESSKSSNTSNPFSIQLD